MAEAPKTMEVELSWKGKTGRALVISIAGETSSYQREGESFDDQTRRILDRAEALHHWVETGDRPLDREAELTNFFKYLVSCKTINAESWMTEDAVQEIIRGYLVSKLPPLGEEEEDTPTASEPEFDRRPKEWNVCGHCELPIVRVLGGEWLHEDLEDYFEWVRKNPNGAMGHQPVPTNVSNS